MTKQSEVNATVNITISPEVLSAFKTLIDFFQTPAKFIKLSVNTGKVVTLETNRKPTTALNNFPGSN